MNSLDIAERGLSSYLGEHRVDNVVSIAGVRPIGAAEFADGQLVGVTLAVNDDGTRHVVPLELSRAVLDHLAVGEPASQPWWGITVASQFGAGSDGSNSRIVVSAIEPNSPAAAAGITVGDIVTKVDDATIAHPTDVVLRVRAAGSFVTLDLERNGNPMTVTMAAGVRPIGATP
jgi:S1-C subfamily serine protease